MRLTFNPRAYAERGGRNNKGAKFPPIAEGFYEVECIELTAVISNAGDKMLKAEFVILDDATYAGRRVWDYILLEHDNPEVLDFARKRLAKWAIAAGKPDLADTDELEHSRCRVKLVIKPPHGEYGPGNKIKFYVAPKVPEDRNGKAQHLAPPEADPEPPPAKAAELDDDIPF